MDPDSKHSCVRYRVTYGSMHKEIPAILLGKIPRKPPVSAENVTEDAPGAEPQREIGAAVSAKDLGKVVFSPQALFGSGEIVVVPRSRGGFTYGRVQQRSECRCPGAEAALAESRDNDTAEEAHLVSGWRVQVSSSGQRKVLIHCTCLADAVGSYCRSDRQSDAHQ